MDTWDIKPQNNTRKPIIQNALDLLSTFLLQVHRGFDALTAFITGVHKLVSLRLALKLGLILFVGFILWEFSTSHFYFKRVSTKVELLKSIKELSGNESSQVSLEVDKELLDMVLELSEYQTDNPKINHFLSDFISFGDSTINRVIRAADSLRLNYLSGEINADSLLLIEVDSLELKIIRLEEEKEELKSRAVARREFKRNIFIVTSIIAFISLWSILIPLLLREESFDGFESLEMKGILILILLLIVSIILALILGYLSSLIPIVWKPWINYVGLIISEVLLAVYFADNVGLLE